MILNVELNSDKNLLNAFNKSFQKLESFFEFSWSRNRPNIYVIDNLNIKKQVYGESAPIWIKAWAVSGGVFILTKDKIKKEEGIEFDDERYEALICHEICHLFISAITKNNWPKWLTEGMCNYISGQLKWKKEINKTSVFLESYDKVQSNLYGEAGWVVKALVDKYGKDKIVQLLKSTKDHQDKNKFEDNFKEIYGFPLNYSHINKLFK